MAEPIRTCLGCRQRKPKRDLLRFAISQDGQVEVDATAKKPGRGAYVCFHIECIQSAMQPKRLQRPLRHPIDQTMIDQLKAELVRTVQEYQQ